MGNELGKGIQVAAFALQGSVELADAVRLVESVSDTLNVKRVYSNTLCQYPTPEGGGGKGYTLFQPITESFIAIDAWEDHGGLYLFVVSCVPFEVARLLAVVCKYYALIDYFNKSMVLSTSVNE